MLIENNSKRLGGVLGELAGQWERVKPFWSDEQSRHFEKEYLVPIMTSIGEALPSLDLLDELMTKIRRDCE